LSLLNHLKNQIEATFKKDPYRFFTEHDLHTELALIATDYLKKNGKLLTETKDKRIVSRVHHEYPTPFRCDMNELNFKVIPEDEFDKKRKESLGFRARRGFMDLVVLNQDFIKSNNLNVVSGKRYKEVLKNLTNQKHSALDLAVEVVYYPTFDEKPHIGIMKRRVASTNQDYEKLVALKKFKFTHNVPFCKDAAMLFFSNTTHKEKLKEMFKSYSEEVPCFKILYSCRT
jgi:hypothetical protein